MTNDELVARLRQLKAESETACEAYKKALLNFELYSLGSYAIKTVEEWLNELQENGIDTYGILPSILSILDTISPEIHPKRYAPTARYESAKAAYLEASARLEKAVERFYRNEPLED